MNDLENLLAKCTTEEQRLTMLRQLLSQLNGAREVSLIEATLCKKAEQQRDALKLVVEAMLLFFSGTPWSVEKAEQWKELVGAQEATTRALCDMARATLASIEGSL